MTEDEMDQFVTIPDESAVTYLAHHFWRLAKSIFIDTIGRHI